MSNLKKCPVCKTQNLEYPEEIKDNKCIVCRITSGNYSGNANSSTWEQERNPAGIERIKIPARIHSELQTFCNLAKGEISGFARTKIIDGDTAVITKVMLLKQNCSTGETKISEDSMNYFLYRLSCRSASATTEEISAEIKQWNLWWHTHADFDVFWSKTDEDNIKNLVSNFKSHFLSVVLNKKGNILGRVDEKQDNKIKSADLPIAIDCYRGYSKLHSRSRDQIKKKVTEIQHPAIRILGNPYFLQDDKWTRKLFDQELLEEDRLNEFLSFHND